MKLEQQKLVNKTYAMAPLLSRVGCKVRGEQTCLCPFHDDHTKSAKFYPDSNQLFCFTEWKTYRSYDVLTELLGLSDLDIMKDLVKRTPIIRSADSNRYCPETFRAGTETERLTLKKSFVTRSIPLSVYLQQLSQFLVLR